jgi:D-alanyl-D-alanine carboxypeptidase.
MAVDQRSEKNIRTLAAEAQPLARELIEKAVLAGINVKIISGHRTYEEQDKIYAQGRTSKGQIVTQARGGYSWHNFGLAFDIGIFSDDGKTYYGEHKDYARVGVIGEKIGLEWGGRWKFKDEPHFQYNPKNYTLAEMRQRKNAGKSLFS